jgi:two-component system sensor histidine kinase DesK
VTTVWDRLRSPSWRNASVVLWTPVLLVAPVLDLHGSPASKAFQLAVVAVIAVSALVAASTGRPPWRDRRASIALAALVLATVAGSLLTSSQWLPTWVLLANALPTVLHGRRLAVGVLGAALASALAAWAVAPHRGERVLAEVFVVLLAGVAAASIASLVDTVAELRRTRQELARAAVADERERMARDLHDLLGHTLSVMVVKAQAVRRLAATDVGAVAEHAADIEEIGRRALVEVRQAVDEMRAPTLAEELVGVRRALDAAGIATSVDWSVEVTSRPADEALAWVLREGATNVLRHSGASSCRIALGQRDGRVTLSIEDDGTGAPQRPSTRLGGLGGLDDRLRAFGGDLTVGSDGSGFRLRATVPASAAVPGHRAGSVVVP